MPNLIALRLVVVLLLVGASVAASAGSARAEPAGARFHVEAEYYKLDNGLRVVLARDVSAPTVTVGVYYGVGFRVEPRGRTGFAHLFEHLMFQGSENLPDFFNSIAAAGGQIGGSTRFDFTRYWETAPTNQLEFMLWGEADRMARPVIQSEKLANQKAVVANEVKAALHNQPYGGWTWLELPQAAFRNWHNAHNFYGDLQDIEAAT
ncbi:M16 family metallopeptidase, partial [Brevundimonas sp.]|uniref:M16 family metallopeptidase n=1 Tax=Brevundimonas sp. TaxID=1871086 RepID=UPI00391AF8C2